MIESMESSGGRREAHKRATKTALAEAAARLFAERGVQESTVKEIAAAAGVTERTFYRYFDGKEELIAAQARAWIDILHETICDRPADEPPYVAVQRALVDVAVRVEGDEDGVWVFAETGERGLLRRATARPLLRVERAMTSALLTRGDDGAETAPSRRERLQAELIARVSIAVLRTALNAHRRMRAENEKSPGVAVLLDDGFALLDELKR
jgi:AcrR family transcriptional regulator